MHIFCAYADSAYLAKLVQGVPEHKPRKQMKNLYISNMALAKEKQAWSRLFSDKNKLAELEIEWREMNCKKLHNLNSSIYE